MGLATVSYGKDPRDPWDEDSYFGQESEWPTVALPAAGAAAAAGATADRTPSALRAQSSGLLAGATAVQGSLDGAAGKFGAIAQAAQQAVSTVQSLQRGGAQALLAPIKQAAMANVADKLPGGPTAFNAYGALSAGKPAAAVAPTLGLPGSLPRIGADVPPSILQKSIV